MEKPTSEHTKAVFELQEKYRCNKCSSNGYCFIKKDPKTNEELNHINLDQKILNLWAAEMIAKPARGTILHPPIHINEIAELIFADPASKSKKSKKAVVSSENTSSVPPINVVCNYPSPSEQSKGPSTPPHPPSKEKHRFEIFSPVFDCLPSDYQDWGLQQYLGWLGSKFEQEEYYESELYEKLKKERIGLDTFKDFGGITPEELKKECDITIGDARRLVGYYKEWELYKKKVYLPLKRYSTCSKLICSNLRRNPRSYCLSQFLC